MALTTDLQKIANSIGHLQTHNRSREATKTALVLPLLVALGYDIFNPEEVIAEYPGDGGASVDFAIIHQGKPEIIIACSAASGPISAQEHPALPAIYQQSGASFLILTNGVNYRVHNQLPHAGGIDPIPLLTFSVNRIDLPSLHQLQRFAKGIFDPQQILAGATALKWQKQLAALFKADLLEPSAAFIRYCATHTYGCLADAEIPAEFTVLVKATYQTFIKNFITNRLQEALNDHLEAINENEAVEKPAAPAPKPQIGPAKRVRIKTLPAATANSPKTPELQELTPKSAETPTEIPPEIPVAPTPEIQILAETPAEEKPAVPPEADPTPPPAGNDNSGLSIEQITGILCDKLVELIHPDRIFVEKKKLYHSIYFDDGGKKSKSLTRVYFTGPVKRQLRYTDINGKNVNKSFGSETKLRLSLEGVVTKTKNLLLATVAGAVQTHAASFPLVSPESTHSTTP